MNLRIQFNMDNAAFTEHDDERPEAARVLRKLADLIENGRPMTDGVSYPVYDVNGNDVGFAVVEQKYKTR
jgi:hypothetical protein